jgi:CBS domain-containing protein
MQLDLPSQPSVNSVPGTPPEKRISARTGGQHKIMTTNAQVIGPQETLQQAAQTVKQLNVGSLPVSTAVGSIGVVTDRDIAVLGTAVGLMSSQAPAIDLMSEGVQWCTEDQDTAEVMETMADNQVRRLPVVNGECELVGIASVGDIATKSPNHVDAMLRKISTPSEPDDNQPAHSAVPHAPSPRR